MEKVDEINPAYLQFLTSDDIPDPAKWVGAISGWEAVYLPDVGGNVTAVHLNDGTGLYVAWSAKRMYIEFNAFYDIDYKSARESYRQFMGGSQNPPIVIHARKTVYVAFKTRSHPHSKHDGAFGYIATRHIASIEAMSMGKTDIRLVGGQRIQLAVGAKKVSHRILEGEAFQIHERHRHSNECNLL